MAALTKTVLPGPAAEDVREVDELTAKLVLAELDDAEDDEAKEEGIVDTLDVAGAEVRRGAPIDPEFEGKLMRELALELLGGGVNVLQGHTVVTEYTVLVTVTSLFWIFHSPAIARELSANRRNDVLRMTGSVLDGVDSRTRWAVVLARFSGARP